MSNQDLISRAHIAQWSWTTDYWTELNPTDKAWLQEHWELADGPRGPKLVPSDSPSWHSWLWTIPVGVGTVAWWTLCILMGWY